MSVIVPYISLDDQLNSPVLEVWDSHYENKELILCLADHPKGEHRKKFDKLPGKHIDCARILDSGAIHLGLTHAMNTGALHARGDILLFANPRIAKSDSGLCILNDLVGAVAAATDMNSKYPVLLVPNGEILSTAEIFCSIRRDHFFQLGMFNEQISMAWTFAREFIYRMNVMGFGYRVLRNWRTLLTYTNSEHDRLEKEAGDEILRVMGFDPEKPLQSA